MTLALCTTVAAGTLVSLIGEATGRLPVRAIGKLAASAAFVALGAHVGLAQAGLAGRAVLVALVLSAIGDLLLLWDDKRVFLAGMIAFLLAHVGYTTAFVAIGVRPAGVLAGAAAMLLVDVAVWRWASPGAGKLAPALAAYQLVITAMVAASFGVALTGPGEGHLALCAGALLFAMSDVCVARHRFVTQHFWNRGIGLPLYYAAQVLLTLAAARAA
jgi:uncharacterized membrane protein YhhN